VLPSPNHFTGVDVPLSTGAVLEGRLVRAFGGSLQGVAGATLELREQRTGRRRSAVTFTDGSFYMLGVPQGEYALEVGARTLDLLRQSAEPLRFIIGPDGEAPAGLEIRLVPAALP
jgi:hypothetical protein